MGGWSCGRKANEKETYNQITDENLQDFRLQAGPSCKYLLQETDQDVAQWGADECAVDGHLGHPRAHVVAVPAAIVSDPGREYLLQSRQGARGEHFSAERVFLKLVEISLREFDDSRQFFFCFQCGGGFCW